MFNYSTGTDVKKAIHNCPLKIHGFGEFLLLFRMSTGAPWYRWSTVWGTTTRLQASSASSICPSDHMGWPNASATPICGKNQPYKRLLFVSVADPIPDPGSGIWCLFDPLIRDLVSGIGLVRIPDAGPRIPDPGSQTHILRA